MRMNINSVDTTSLPEFKVNFFGIQPGERAIVRFLIDTDADFDVVTLHNVEVGENKTIRVDCIRDPHDSVDKCPLCANGVKVEQRVFIRMLHYIQREDGTFVPKCKIWDRSVRSDLITTLKTYLMDYGPLSQIICSITRNGSGLDTTYTVSPNLPGSERYPIDASGFEGFDVCGTIVKEWEASQMNEFLMSGTLPSAAKSSTAENVSSTVTPVADAAPVAQAYAPSAPASTPDGAQRPRRVYN